MRLKPKRPNRALTLFEIRTQRAMLRMRLRSGLFSLKRRDKKHR